jgi:hypothetical protein
LGNIIKKLNRIHVRINSENNRPFQSLESSGYPSTATNAGISKSTLMAGLSAGFPGLSLP